MKLNLMLLFIFISITSNAQIIDAYKTDNQGKVVISEVITLDSTVTKNELYIRGKRFMTSYWRSAKDVTQLDDKDEGIISTSGFQDIIITIIGIPYKYKLFYSFTISTKQGKYKVEFNRIRFQGYPDQYSTNPKEEYAEDVFNTKNFFKGNGKPKDRYDQYKKQLEKVTNSAIIDLEKSMSSSIGSDW